MKRFIIAALVGLAIGYILMRLSQRRQLSGPPSEEDEPAETFTSTPAP